MPTLALVRQSLAGGLRPFLAALATPEAQRAFGLTLGITAVATVVGVMLAFLWEYLFPSRPKKPKAARSAAT